MFEIVTRARAMELGLSRYFVGKACKYGHIAQRTTLSMNCTACLVIHKADYRKRNVFKRAAYYIENKERENANSRTYYARNKDRRQRQGKEYRANNPDDVRMGNARWRHANPSYASQHRLDNAPKYRVYRENRRAREANGVLSRNIVERLYERQRGMCACCSVALGDRYHLDHVIPLSRGGSNTDDNVQLLLDKCNARKGSRLPTEIRR